MLRSLAALAALGVGVHTARAAPSPAPPLPAGVKRVARGASIPGAPEAHKYILPNGLRVLVVPDDRNPVASLRILLDAGSNHESPGRTGLAHFFEHMMFRKTRLTEEGHYDRVLAGVGGSGNAATSTDYVVYESTFPGPALDLMLELEAQRFVALELKDPYFTTEKGAVISERRLRYENDPMQRGNEVLRSIVERGTPYAWLTIGAKADVENMGIDDARAFYERFYKPDNALLSIGGPFAPDAVVRKIHDRFSQWKGKAEPFAPALPDDHLTRHAGKDFLCSEAVMDGVVTLVFPSAETSPQAALMAQVFNMMLNDHPEGPFQRRLARTKLATGFSAYKVTWQKQRQPLQVAFRLNRAQTPEAAESFWWKAVEDVLRKPLDGRIRRLFDKQVALEEAELAARMTTMLQNYEWNEYFYGDFMAPDKVRKAMAALSQDGFRTWVRKAFAKERMFRMGVVPEGKAKPCRDLAALHASAPREDAR